MSLPAQTIALGERRLGRIGLGTNRLTDLPGNRAFLQEAVAAGVNHIDTAHLYSSGDSEKAIGNTLAPAPADLTVATKGHYNGGGPEVLREHLETSFGRLRTDSIALYYVHRFDAKFSIEETLAPLREAHEAGRVENVGISEVSVEEIQIARGVVPIGAVQNEYSLNQRKHEAVVDYCTEVGIAFVPFFPLRGGTSGAVEQVAEAHDATPEQVKLAWLLRRSPVMAPIPGTLSIEHLRTNLGAVEIELSDEEFEELGSA